MSEALETIDAGEPEIDQLLDQTVLKMTPALLMSFVYEVARKMHPPANIAARYGFADVPSMIAVIAANEALRERIKSERAVWNSSENLEHRLRVQHQLILHEAAHENAKPLFDPSTTVPQRVDLLKAIATVGGVHGMPGGGGHGGPGGEQGARWTIQMVFPNAGKMEEITLRSPPSPPPTIEGEPE